ncbi:MAG: hypothetical protein N4A62_03845 [Marinisporobacter sp.]|jgi:hypothetical protein|nr:hypothetical protein [Marinisporobacter sp.]
MKVKQGLLLVMIFMMILTIPGCKKNIKAVQAPERKDCIKEKPIDQPITTEKKKEENEKSTLITDPTKLVDLWNEYFHAAISTIGRNGNDEFNFDDPKTIHPTDIAKYCFFKYVYEHDKESLKCNEKGESLFPIDTALKYAKQYFNVTHLDLSKLDDDDSYDTQKHAFTFDYDHADYGKNTYDDLDHFDVQLDQVIKNSDGTLTAKLVCYNIYQSKQVDYTQTYTLKERKDKSLYFLKGKGEYIHHFIDLESKDNHFHKISGFEGNVGDLSIGAEIDHHIILQSQLHCGDKEDPPRLLLVNTDTFCVEKELILDHNIEYLNSRFTGNKLMFFLKNKILVFNTNLEPLEDIPLPKVFLEKRNLTKSYDLSNDLSKLVYIDEMGLNIIDIVDGRETLLCTIDHILDQNKTKLDKGMREHYCVYCPRFNTKDKKIMAKITYYGYDMNIGYTLFNLENQTIKTNIVNRDGAHIVNDDKGILIGDYVRADFHKNPPKTLYFDFESEELREKKVEDIKQVSNLGCGGICGGKNFAAFTPFIPHDEYNNPKDMYRINQIGYKDLKIKPYFLSIAPDIIGVLKDGRILFSYRLGFDPSDMGICITK